MIKIITKKKYNELVARLEMLQEAKSDEPLYAFIALDEERERSRKYKKLYADELQKRLELVEIVKRLENGNCDL